MALNEPLALNPTASQFILLHEQDSILVCTSTARAGCTVIINKQEYMLTSDILLGHKIARVALMVGDPVFRSGVKIGSMIAGVAPGEHVHSHNLKSDYIPAHGRGAVRIGEIRS